MTLPQLTALRAVGWLQPSTIGEVAKAIQLGPATASDILNRLEKRGLVRRSREGRDRRTVTVELTSEGTRVVRSAPPLLGDRFRHAMDQLRDWERTQILAVLQRIGCIMDEAGIEASSIPARGVGVLGRNDVPSERGMRVTTPSEILPPASRDSPTVNGNGQSSLRKRKPKA
jgi:DNA-binding MarR family transcriptional regulator